MMFPLPDDILYIILDILGDERDHNSLYQCAISSSCFTEQALTILYKLYESSPLSGGGTEDEQFRTRRTGTTLVQLKSDQDTVVRKWALMWRSIALSTLDKTYLPYYSYIRCLDLNDLSSLLTNSGFTGKIRNEFFTPELHDLVSRDYESKGNKRLRSSRSLPHDEWIVPKLGSAIVERTTSIREMRCNIQPSLLAEWLEGLPLLQAMTIWSGRSLTHHAGEKIRNHCPDFKQIRIYTWTNEFDRNSEIDSEEFLNELRPHTLEYFEVISWCLLGPRSIKAIGTQLNSLTELKLTSLGIEAIAELPSLTAPPALKVLILTDSIPATRNEEFYSIVTRVADWIRSCGALQRLELRRFVDDSALLPEVLNDEGIRLSNLRLDSYAMTGSRDFHTALASQQSLQYLYLRGEGSEIPQDNELLVQAISQLNDLRELELKGISDYFTPDHVMTLAPYLPHLERLWVGGDLFDDDVWSAFQCLQNLQSLVIHALSEFTTEGILDFISQLGSGNRGLDLSILNSTTETDITDEAQSLIRDTLKNALDGTFDFGLAQEEYSDEDSEAEISE